VAILLFADLTPRRGVLVHKNSLASCQRCRHSERFDMKGLSFDTFFITVWYKLCRCFWLLFGTNCAVVITEYWSWNHVHTTNELVDRIRKLKSNAPQNDYE